jgi:hypothetical protein
LSQRLRWASKWSSSPGLLSKLSAIFTIAVQLAFLSAIAMNLSNETPATLYLVGAKVVVEFIFLFSVCQHFNINLSIWQFIALQLLYPFYILYVGVRANFGRIRWKGRNI